MSLNENQQDCFDTFKKGNSMVITGPAGCGKSYLIKHIKEYCHTNLINIAITAYTGAAASLIGGVTLHGWAGVGLARGSSQELYQNMRRYRQPSIRKWCDVKVLIIDEISMIDASLFNKLHHLAQHIRGNSDFFGGIQVILCGDFAQLKPIPDKGTPVKFCFESTIWQHYLDKNTFYMSEIMRQTDPVFQRILQNIRLGKITKEDKHELNKCLITDERDADIIVQLSDGTEQKIRSTLLYPKRKDVNKFNILELKKLIDGGVIQKVFSSVDTVTDTRSRKKIPLTEAHVKVINNCTASPQEITLAVGAQVMLIKNLDVEEGMVNGSRGVITEFDNCGYPVVMFDNGVQKTIVPETFDTESGNVSLTRSQIPLILAWALTVHKCQGATLTNVITDLTDVFEEAQIYVTLSRVCSLNGLSIININYSKIKCNSKVKDYYDSLCSRT